MFLSRNHYDNVSYSCLCQDFDCVAKHMYCGDGIVGSRQQMFPLSVTHSDKLKLVFNAQSEPLTFLK